MRPLGWFIKVLLTAIGKLNFYRKFFAIYLPLNISTPPRSEGPPSPFYPFGTLFSNLALEPCIGFEPKNPFYYQKNTTFCDSGLRDLLYRVLYQGLQKEFIAVLMNHEE